MSIKKKIFAGAVGLIGGLALTAVVLAAPGDPVPPGSITTIGPSGNCGGIGVAYDGTNILYTCASEPKVRKTDLTGANLGDVSTVDSVTGGPVTLDAIAWDANDGKLWGGNLGGGSCHIYETDMSTGVATLKFSFVDTHGGCSFSFFDGLTVDTNTNTLWLSPDVHNFIHHYTKAGVEIPADLIDFTSLTLGQCPFAQGSGNAGCWNSGLTIGIDGHLFAGTNGDGKIYELNPGPPASLVTPLGFSTVSGRDEDLECGPVVNGLETILSRDFNNPKIDVLEAPAGTCKSAAKPEDTRRMTGGGTIPAGRRTLEGKHGLELYCDVTKGPNNLEVNWGKGNNFHLDTLTSATCSDDPNITPNPPAAGFDTYVGKGTGRYNGVAGYTAKWKFTDAGEPGFNDKATITIFDPASLPIATFSGNLSKGNQQAHNP